jgi:hypothetical protein
MKSKQAPFSSVAVFCTAIAACFVISACAHHETSSPVQTEQAPHFTSDVRNRGGHTASGSKRVVQKSSLTTPPGADYGAPTGSSSGSGAQP